MSRSLVRGALIAVSLLLPWSACTPPRAPVGLRATIGTITDLRAADPMAMPKLLGEALKVVLNRELNLRRRFGPEAVSDRRLILSPELLSATLAPISHPGSRGVPSTGETRRAYLQDEGTGFKLQARVRLHVRQVQGGAPLKSYVASRERFQSYAPTPYDVAELATMIAATLHDQVAADFEALYKVVQEGGTSLPGAAPAAAPAPAAPPASPPAPAPGASPSPAPATAPAAAPAPTPAAPAAPAPGTPANAAPEK